MILRLGYLLLTLWLCAFDVAYASAEPLIVIVSSERSPAYVEAIEALISELERNGVSRYEMLQVSVQEWTGAVAASRPKVIVALGSDAATALAKADTRTPVLCALLPRSSFERILRVTGRKMSPQFSALYLDQPFSRQLELIRMALPAVHRIGVLWGPESRQQANALKGLVQSKGMELVEANVERNELIFPELKKILDDAGLLLAVADPQVYNSSSIQNILLSSFRARVPLVAFSPAYVRAGALLALYVTPSQIGLQAATMARSVIQGKTLSSTPVYSQDFDVAVNVHVAHSLGLTLDAAAL